MAPPKTTKKPTLRLTPRPVKPRTTIAKPAPVKAPAKPEKLPDRAALDRHTQKILQLKKQIARGFWEIGRSLVEIDDQKLYRTAGYQSFSAYLREEVAFSRSTAYELMKIARNFSEQTALQYGQEKLLGAIALAKATPEDERPVDVTRYDVEVREPDGTLQLKPFSEASSNEIRTAADRIRRRQQIRRVSPQKLPTIAPSPTSRVAAFLANARRSLAKLSPRPEIALELTGQGTDPRCALEIRGLALSLLADVLSRLARYAR
ncbi:MAG: DUF3102 domain-containing protein [Deltaproteobacteria bacterium]|nr:DUF3102 domain-containing protein [Deltaproteobacteria bacterium]